jgi:hypothetical protein
MAIELIVENGSLVENANTFVTQEEAIAYAAQRGVALEEGDELAAWLVRAGDWINAQDSRLKGMQVSLSQAMVYPRAGIFVNYEELPDNEIPRAVKTAQILVAMAIREGMPVLENVEGPILKSEQIGPLAFVYENSSMELGQARLTAAEAALRPLVSNSGGFQTVRV